MTKKRLITGPSCFKKRARSSRSLISLGIFLLLQLSLPGFLRLQPENGQGQQEILHHEVSVILKLVQVYVSDKKEKPVRDLTSADFEIFDNGKPQTISHFERHFLSRPEGQTRETEPPAPAEISGRMNRKFFLFFDFAFNNPGGIAMAQKAALHFIDSQVFPTDEVGILSFSVEKGLMLHAYLTRDLAKIREIVPKVGLGDALGKAGSLLEEFEGETVGGGGGGSMRSGLLAQAREKMNEVAGRMQLANQVYSFSLAIKNLAQALRYIPGYKHIILFSTGVPGRMISQNLGLRAKYEEMSRELGAANSPVFSVNVEGLSTISAETDFAQLARRTRQIDVPGPSTSLENNTGRNALREMASLSGGKYFGDINNYEKIVEEIQNLTASYYVLGYAIDEKWDGQYHNIKVEVRRKGCTVNAQRGYFNPKPFSEYTELEKKLHLIDLALNEEPYFEEPIHFPLMALSSSVKKRSTLTMIAKIPSDKMREVLGKNAEIVALIFDEQKRLVGYQRRETNISAFAQNVLYHHSVSSLPPGTYDCRVVVRNLETGRGAVAAASAHLPKEMDFGLRLYSPLLLQPEKDSHYLEGSPPLVSVYPFDSSQYSPVVQEMSPGVTKILAVVRCSIIDYPQTEVQFSARLIELASGKEIPLPATVLGHSEEEDNKTYLLELETGELKPGRYALYLFAENMNAEPISSAFSTFSVR